MKSKSKLVKNKGLTRERMHVWVGVIVCISVCVGMVTELHLI